MLCIGHRGACGHEPENTLRSVRRALELGVDAVEIDVQWVDGELVVFHDAKLDRTTNGRGYLRKKRFAHLRTLDAGRGERIPTLREVVELIDRRAFLNIELKGRRTAEPVTALFDKFLAQPGWKPEHFLVSSFRWVELVRFRKAASPGIPIGLLFNRPVSVFRWARAVGRLRASSVHSAVRFTKPRFVKAAHERGLKVYVYTVNTAAVLERMRACGVDGVFTDFPDIRGVGKQTGNLVLSGEGVMHD